MVRCCYFQRFHGTSLLLMAYYFGRPRFMGYLVGSIESQKGFPLHVPTGLQATRMIRWFLYLCSVFHYCMWNVCSVLAKARLFSWWQRRVNSAVFFLYVWCWFTVLNQFELIESCKWCLLVPFFFLWYIKDAWIKGKKKKNLAVWAKKTCLLVEFSPTVIWLPRV